MESRYGETYTGFGKEKIMEIKDMLKHVDHTKLQAFCTWEEIQVLCEEAMEYETASVCIPPAYVQRVHQTYGDKINICTVIGFPLGYQEPAAKVAEAKAAIMQGCNEIDMVINITDVKNGLYDKVEEEIRLIKKACQGHILKVIIETCYLTEEEKIAMCKVVTNAGADYIKTSTGFGTDGATVEDVKLFKAHIGPNVKIKAAGGVSSVEDLQTFLELGCDRIGTSRAIGICKGLLTEVY